MNFAALSILENGEISVRRSPTIRYSTMTTTNENLQQLATKEPGTLSHPEGSDDEEKENGEDLQQLATKEPGNFSHPEGSDDEEKENGEDLQQLATKEPGTL